MYSDMVRNIYKNPQRAIHLAQQCEGYLDKDGRETIDAVSQMDPDDQLISMALFLNRKLGFPEGKRILSQLIADVHLEQSKEMGIAENIKFHRENSADGR